MTRFLVWGAAAALGLLAGPEAKAEGSNAPGSVSVVSGATNREAPGSQMISFSRDVAPIVFQRCAGCHRPGQAAPFSLLSYADVKKRAKQISEVVTKRYMPPWLPEPGDYEFQGDLSLKPAQIETIRRWVAEGAIEGDAAQLPQLPKWSSEWQGGTPDLIVRLPQPYTVPPEEKDIYRNFV